MSQREEAEEEGVHPTETPLCGQPESQTGAQSPEQQRPESAGRRMDVEDNVSTESLPEIKLSNLDIWCLPTPFDPFAGEVRIDDVISPLDPKGSPSPTSSGYSSTSGLSFKSDGSKDNTIINFKERRSILIPEQQRPESAGLKMTVKKIWSIFWRGLLAIHSLLKSRTSSGYSSASKLYLKRDRSKENVLNFKETQSPLREKDTSLSTTPEIVVAGGMETS